MIFDNLVSVGTLGMQSRREANALFIDWVRLLSFLLLPPITIVLDADVAPFPAPEFTPRWWLGMFFRFSAPLTLRMLMLLPFVVDDESGVPWIPDDKEDGKW